MRERRGQNPEQVFFKGISLGEQLKYIKKAKNSDIHFIMNNTFYYELYR